MKFDVEGNRVTSSKENEKCKEMWNDFEIPWIYRIREKPGIKIKIKQLDLEWSHFWHEGFPYTSDEDRYLKEEETLDQIYIDLLHEDIDCRSGFWKGNDSFRSVRLSLAGANVWQVGHYIPKRFSYAKDDDLSKIILQNKDGDFSSLLAVSMIIKAKLEKFPLLCADVIVPVPNFHSTESTKAISIAKKVSILINENYPNKEIKFQNVLRKTIDRSTKGMTRSEKEEFYGENKVYQFNSNYDIKEKNILLIDDVVTAGFTAQQCIKELLENGANSVYFYATATTKT